jgi:hypothetical protein
MLALVRYIKQSGDHVMITSQFSAIFTNFLRKNRRFSLKLFSAEKSAFFLKNNDPLFAQFSNVLR